MGPAAPAGVLVVLLVLAGCGADPGPGGEQPSSDGSGPSPTRTSPTQPSPTPAPGPGPDVGRYVALGDSYTAAPFVPTTEQETGCLRSDGNYPHLLADALGVETLVDVSCTGADATAMIGRQKTIGGSVDPQFDALTPGTDLVTLGLGGNDFGVFSTLVQGCVALASRDPGGSPCRDDQQQGGEDALLAVLPDVGDRTAAVLSGVAGRSPRARVLLVGYPQIAPERGRCEGLPLADGDYAYARRVTAGLNDALRGAARDAGATFVDVGAASAGHDICADEPWVNGRSTDQQAALAYHPFAAGQRAVARLVRRTLAGAGPAA